MRMATERESGDGCAVSTSFMAGLNHNERRRREGDFRSLASDAYCGALVSRYGTDPARVPVWVLAELFSFGSFTSLYLFCAKRWGNKEMENEHYMLRQAQFVRYACAHSSNIINGFGIKDNTVDTNINIERALTETGLSHRTRTARMRNPRLRQIATVMYLHSKLIREGQTRLRARRDLSELKKRMAAMVELTPTNDTIRSSFGFLTCLIDSWF